MENPSRNLAQHKQVKSTGRAPDGSRRWRVLLVDDLGKVLSWHLSKPLLFAVAVSLAAVLSISVYSIVSYYALREEKSALQKGVDKLTAQLEIAENAKQEALVRLMLLEDRVKWAAKKDEARPADKAKDAASEVAVLNPGSVETGKPEASETPNLPAPEPQPKQPARDTASPPPAVARVSVEDLQIWYEPDGNAFKFKFKVKNIDRDGGKVAGYAFLVLEPREDSREPPRAFPPSPLADGKPSDFKSGHHFSIARYTFIRGTLTDISAIRRFKTAIVYAYSDAGHLLVEKVFEVG